MKQLSVRQQANRIHKWYDKASKEQVIEGSQWYAAAHSLALTLATNYGVSILQAAQVISVLSPQKSWGTNKTEAVAIFNQHFNIVQPIKGYFATQKTIQECHLIMGGHFLIPSRRTKTYSFADNIAYVDSIEVTIDRHALRVCYDDTSAKINKVGINQYKHARQAYIHVAASIGIKPYQLQAITWVTYKQHVGR